MIKIANSEQKDSIMAQIWYELKITATSEASEAISEFLTSVGAFGIAIKDPFEFERIINSETQLLYIDDALIEDDEVIISAFFAYDENGINVSIKLAEDENPYLDLDRCLYQNLPSDYITLLEFKEMIALKLAEMKEYLDLGKAVFTLDEVKEEDWANDWKKYYHQLKISDRLIVAPTWDLPDDTAIRDKILIKLDPGSAFGTGSHETTVLCLTILEKILLNDKDFLQAPFEGRKVLDLGCGSGILAIACEKMGCYEIDAMDLDYNAVKVAEENAKLNECQKIKFFAHGIEKSCAKYNLLVANILAEVLASLKDQLILHTEKGGLLVLSGIIESKLPLLNSYFESQDLQLISKMSSNDWYALVFKKIS